MRKGSPTNPLMQIFCGLHSWNGMVTAALKQTAEQGIILNVQQKSLCQMEKFKVTILFSVRWLHTEFFLPTPVYCYEQYSNSLCMFSVLNLNTFGKWSKTY